MDSHKQAKKNDWILIFGAWLIAAISTAGSLFFSEVMDLVRAPIKFQNPPERIH